MEKIRKTEESLIKLIKKKGENIIINIRNEKGGIIPESTNNARKVKDFINKFMPINL